MFSGIVEECARVTGIVKEQENVHFTLQCSFVDELKIHTSAEYPIQAVTQNKKE